MKIYLPDPIDGFARYVDTLAELGAWVQADDPDGCAGLLLPGGGDIHPRHYGQDDRGCADIDEARDARELTALERFASAGRPVLGICRGAQLINVFFGGTLHQDIPGHSQINGEDRIHGSRTDDPLLRELYGERFPVNSSHHQAVDCLGSGLRAVQWAEDGTVEAIRHDTLPVFAVQWHPERLRRPTDGKRLLVRWLASLR